MYSARMSGAERAITVSTVALDDAAQMLRDKYDILLDRITARLLDMSSSGLRRNASSRMTDFKRAPAVIRHSDVLRT